MASVILNGKVAELKLRHIERLCKGLKCTPNDLFEWIPDEGKTEQGFPLTGLRRDKKMDMQKTMERFTMEELERILQMIGKEVSS
jgi:hypothetical protein